MYTHLKDNPEHTRQLCEALGLGQSSGEVKRLSGGFHHLVWRLETARGSFVVKQLAPDTDMEDPAKREHFNASERVAEAFAESGIRAIHALRRGEDYLQLCDGIGYLVYPWTDAVALEKGVVSERHALEVARLLARMHRADIDAPVIAAEEQKPVTTPELREIARLAAEREVEGADEIARRLDEFEAICAARVEAAEILERRQVVSHGDLDQKNVVWSAEGEPVLIDWESARALNPTRELLEVALDWSGLRFTFDEPLFGRFIRAYQLAGGTMEPEEIDAAVRAVLGGWLDWLAYNLGRVLNLEQEQQRALGRRQVELALSTIALLQKLAPSLTAILEDENVSS